MPPGGSDITLGRIGGGLILLGIPALVYTSVIGADLIVPAILLGVGAAVVSVAGPRPLDARLTRAGLAFLAVGGLSVAVGLAIESTDAEMADLVPVLIAVATIPVGCLATGVSLARSSGFVRAVGAVVLSGLVLALIGEVIGLGSAGPPSAILLLGVAVTGVGLAGVGVLTLGLTRLEGPARA